jgi:hypothetical protein
MCVCVCVCVCVRACVASVRACECACVPLCDWAVLVSAAVHRCTAVDGVCVAVRAIELVVDHDSDAGQLQCPGSH